MRGDQRAEARAVNHGDVLQIEDDILLALCQQALHFFAKRNGFFPENDAPVQRQHGNSIDFVTCHPESHFCSPSLSEYDFRCDQGEPTNKIAGISHKLPSTRENTPIARYRVLTS